MVSTDWKRAEGEVCHWVRRLLRMPGGVLYREGAVVERTVEEPGATPVN